VKILVVDDHPLIRQALQNVLHQLDAAAQILEAPDCARALDLAAAHTDLDIVLLDLYLPGMGGLDGLSLLRERYPGLPVVVLSASNDRQTVLDAIEKGAMGFIPKSSSNEVMLGALRLVLSGGVYLPPAILGNHSAVTDISAATPSAPLPARSPADLGLTERQLQVLALMLQGKSNKLICRELNLAEGTVKIHVSAILKALNVTSRTQAVVTVSRLGLKLDALAAATGANRPA
jgi:DNA-binding NarL/FixJ family response regulator